MYISLTFMITAGTMEGTSRQNELEHQRRLNAKLREEFGPVVVELLDESTQPGNRVTDIVLNADGQVHVKRSGQYKLAGILDARRAKSAIATVATMRDTVVTESQPQLHTKLPFWGARFAAAIPPMAAAPIFSIRIKSLHLITLAEYVAQGVLSASHRDAIETAILGRKNILVVGETGSGKTTFANAVMDGIARLRPNARLVVIEDTPELQVKVVNYLSLFATGLEVTMQDCLIASLRHDPDSIVVGEVRGGEALVMVSAWGTGHNGGVATCHAKDAHEGLVRIERCAAIATAASQHAAIASAVNLVVAISNELPEGRKVREVARVLGYENGRYQLELLS